MSGNDMQDLDQLIDKLPHLFETLGENIPKLIRGIKSEIFSPEAGKDLGKAVGSFYQELISAGIEPAQALELTREYMKTLDKVSDQMRSEGGHGHSWQWNSK